MAKRGFRRNKNRVEKHRMSIAIDMDVFLFFAEMARMGDSSLGRVLNKALRSRALQIQASARSLANEKTFPRERESTKSNEQPNNN